MPVYAFKCDNGHRLEKFKKSPYKKVVRFRCKKCGLYMYRDWKTEYKPNHIMHIDRNEEPAHHQLKKRSTKGIWIDALTPEPVYVTSKAQYDKLLRDTHSREKVSKYDAGQSR